jgi:excisionase family DNA binding protein
MELLTRYRLAVADSSTASRGADLLKRRSPADRVQVVLVHADGTDEAVEVPDAAVRMLTDLLETAARGGEVALLAEDAEISPEDAAAILGISRPLVRQRMDRGELPFRRVGAHRRIRVSDVLALRRREEPVRAALAELQADTEELMARGL